MPAFGKLSAELIELIARLLEPADLFSFRLVCRAFYDTTFPYFSRTCLATVRTDLSRESLRELEALAANERLRTQVRTLLFHGRTDIGRGFVWHRHPSSGHLLLSALLQVPAVQTLRDLLLHKLVNCRSFHVYSHYWEHMLDFETLWPTDVVTVLFAIVSDTGLPIQSFHLEYLRRGTGPGNRRVTTDRLCFEQSRTPEFRAAWAHLQALTLEQSVSLDIFDWLMELILHAPRLQKLGLNLDYVDLSTDFIDRLSSAEALPRLQELRLYGFRFTEATILRLILRLGESLRSVLFRFATIYSGGTWVAVLRALRCNCPLLDSIWLYNHAEWPQEDRQ
ncbi:Uncharacterized protein T310_6654 [Rasamsonia emersonii CBS 393.64]|uniref:F-box domain-containing protein n=1 Tax=Rasamsonia emersonii (strain ATCC 16479 / CBS 393.64 / IMI 116815) TaxID=1408163 RepID=A0A0F4YM54_RASE3|nr:Uncharacterized protein T310_6654 [Rasamsonia emersonii CBS 393.64]KKA19372.1 Uncharacterized protein T310_6654 [Rasamsonia emersonii CBS 393.64]